MSTNPILICFEQEGCPACILFEHEWNKLRANKQLQTNVRMVKFTIDGTHSIHSSLSKSVGWYPSIILAGPKSYYKVFTQEDTFNFLDYVEGYQIKAIKYNSVEENGLYKYLGRNDSAELIEFWVNQHLDDVVYFDDIGPPKKYENIFPPLNNDQLKNNINYGYLS